MSKNSDAIGHTLQDFSPRRSPCVFGDSSHSTGVSVAGQQDAAPLRRLTIRIYHSWLAISSKNRNDKRSWAHPLVGGGARDSGPLWMWKVRGGTGWKQSVLEVRTGKRARVPRSAVRNYRQPKDAHSGTLALVLAGFQAT